jgi:hypothetical protein
MVRDQVNWVDVWRAVAHYLQKKCDIIRLSKAWYSEHEE